MCDFSSEMPIWGNPGKGFNNVARRKVDINQTNLSLKTRFTTVSFQTTPYLTGSRLSFWRTEGFKVICIRFQGINLVESHRPNWED